MLNTTGILLLSGIILVPLCVGFYLTYKVYKQYKNSIFIYPKNKHKYVITDICRLKSPESGIWYDAYIYKDIKTNNLYIREQNDFKNKFILVKDYKLKNDGNN